MKKLTLKHCLACVAALLGVLIFVFSFVTALKSFDSAGELSAKYYNVIWGSKKATVYGIPVLGDVTDTIPEESRFGALALPLIASILALVAGLGAVALAFLAPEKKVLFFVVAGVFLAVAVVVALTPAFAFNAIAKKQAELMHCSVKDAKDAMKEAGGSLKAPLSVVSAVLAFLGCGCAVGAAVVKK